jgi:hypothetical protein
MGERFTATRTVHAILPATHRPLCGYEEERPAWPGGASTVACPECTALLRSGLVPRARPSSGDAERSKGEGHGHPARLHRREPR